MRSPEKVRIAGAIIRGLHKLSMTNRQLAVALGVSETMVGFWRTGRYAPSINRATAMTELLDEPMILHFAKLATTGTCRVCLAPFVKRESRGQLTRRAYCSQRCQRDYHKGVRARNKPASELAIAAYCAGCEPEGICRTADCPLRAFSPFLFIARTAA